MLELRRHIDEVRPEVVVCEDENLKEFAEKLLSGLGFEIRVLTDEEKKSKALYMRALRAVWLGSGKPPMVGKYYFAFWYTGGVPCS